MLKQLVTGQCIEYRCGKNVEKGIVEYQTPRPHYPGVVEVRIALSQDHGILYDLMELEEGIYTQNGTEFEFEILDYEPF